jgi:hypothetical protein
MIRKFAGDKKSIEARSEDGGKTWTVTLFDCGRETRYVDATLAEVQELATQQGMRPVPAR